MKNLALYTVGCALFFADPSFAQECGFNSYGSYMENSYPTLYNESNDNLNQIYTNTAQNNYRITDETLTINVVVHVLHFGEPEGEGYNISKSQITTAISHLNETFQNRNPDRNNVPSRFLDRVGDADIVFRLACFATDGSDTDGIVRRETTKEVYQIPYLFDKNDDEEIKTTKGGWDPSKYLNIWLVKELKRGNNDVAGYSTRPPSQPYPYDGIVLKTDLFGTTTGNNVSNKALTHEVGHYLGIAHIWENLKGQGGCDYDDGINDTPLQDKSSEEKQNYFCNYMESCGNGPDGGDMFVNYMDYSLCPHMFTVGQVAVMREVLISGPRQELTNTCTITGINDEAKIYDYPLNGSAGGLVELDGHYNGYDPPVNWSWEVNLKYYIESNNTEGRYTIASGQTNTNDNISSNNDYYSSWSAVLSNNIPAGYKWYRNGNGTIEAEFVLIVEDNTGWINSDIKDFTFSLPPLEVSISGPDYGNCQDTYTWSANISNGYSPYTFYWEQSTDNGYSYSFAGSSSSISRQMPYKEDLYLRLTVTDDYGSSGVAHHITKITDAPEFNYVSVNGQLISNYETVWLCPSYDNWVTADLSDNSICIDWYYSELLYHTDYCRDSSFDFDGNPFSLTLVATNICGSNDFNILFENHINCPMMLSVYPNPSTDELTVEMSDDDPNTDQENISEIVIYDKVGNKIKEIRENARSLKFSVHDLKEGDYILHVQILDKIIKQHIKIER